MKISLNCKLDNYGAYGFIKPIADIEEVQEITVFRDMPGTECDKVKYVVPRVKTPALLGQVCKFFQMLGRVKRGTKVAIGIYEIPHGLLAFVVGKIKGVPSVICVIGNPGYSKIRKGLRKKLTYYMLKRCAAVTVTGSQAKKILVENGVDENKILILPNAFDGDEFKPSGAEKKYDIMTLCYLGPEKELLNFVKIVAVLKESKPDIKAAIVGKGPERERIEDAIKELSLEDNIDMLGYVPDAAQCFNESRVFVLTSSTEGLPRTVIEAMACGVPCVVSRVGDVEDVVVDGKNGFVIGSYDNIEGFAGKISVLLSDDKLYERCSREALLLVGEKYSRKAASELWQEIFYMTKNERKKA